MRFLIFFLSALALLNTGCERVPRLAEYKRGGVEMYRESAPIVLVGRILAFKEIGNPRPGRWDTTLSIQLCKLTVQVENVLRGDVGLGTVPIYYLSSTRLMGHPRMGMVGRGGIWQIGDRSIFFLVLDSGVLRTIRDTWASATPLVLTGPHPDYKPQPNESLADRVIDIQLDRGKGCSDQQWAHAIDSTPTYFYDLPYTVRKLRQIASSGTPLAQQAAKKELEALSYSWPKIREGWPF